MSSSYIMEPRENESKKDDTLIIVVNEDGIISVDQETLQNLIMNQSDANVSVVRLGQTEGDAGNGSITLTVDPPTFVPPDATSGSTDGPSTNDSGGLVDPFMEMDPEQLERLETALQSEEAKQILGENVTAMLDMLTVEEQQNSLKYSIQLDHCYTSRTCPSDPKPSDPLPIANSPDDDNVGYVQSTTSPRSQVAPVTANIANATVTPTRSKGKPGRPRKDAKAGIPSQGCTPKSTGGSIPRSMMNVLQGANKGALVPLIKPLDLNELHTASAAQQDGADEDGGPSSSSESSESEPPSDNDSDFGPRGPRRGGVRARGGRKGLTTRGGSMAASRRRGSNKHMNIEQVRRLDMEMAAAVDAMKSPEKEDKSEKFHPARGRKQLRTFGRRKIEMPSTPRGADTLESSPASFEKTLHTTNQVKANLISANMIKGDMILTKPGQAKLNNQQKVIFVQKQVMMKTGELKNLGMKKQIVIPKGASVLSDVQGTKATKQAALTVSTPKAVTQTTQVIQPKIAHAAQASPGQPQTPIQQQIPPQSPPSQKVTSPASGKTKASPEVKKEKKKSESISESPIKSEPDLGKLADTKTPDASKKPPKREQRKSPAILADTLGPALFSTPDIIRRVGSTGEPKTPDTPVTPVIPTATGGCTAIPIASSASVLPDTVAASGVSNAEETSTSTTDGKVTCAGTVEQSLESAMEMDNQSAAPANNSTQKTDTKVPLAEDLQPSIDSASNSAPPEGVVQPAEEPIVPNHIVSQSNAMEGEEQLLATLEMEASKHEEELLAEALLLQEELGVDLAEHATLVEQTPTVVSEPLMSSPTFTHSVVSSIEDDAKAISSASATVPPSPSVVAEQSKKSVRDEKEPIQIIRGGRIITLPPIEAPATRSKKLQARGESVQKKSEVNKKNERFNKQSIEQRLQRKEEINMNIENEVNNGGEGGVDDDDDDDDEEEAEEDNSDSEDDPDRLWCICKRPHNNRFMICCDVCEDWFHGKCVHVSKAMGQEMEEKGIEWVCPNCTKKKAEEAKPKVNLPSTPARHQKALESSLRNASASPRLQNLSIAASVLARSPASAGAISNEAIMAIPGVTQCMVCKKEARASSIYCSDACILTHAQESLTKDKSSTPEQQSKAVKSPILDAARAKPDGRVIVFERKSGKVLTGVDAPTRSNLRVWLKENPTFEVVRPDNLNTLQIGGKTVTAIQTQGVGRMNKAALQAGRTPQGQSKMIFTKVPGSKQTVLAASNKKIVVISGAQQSSSSPSPKSIQSKQMPTAVSRGAMGTTRQILPKTAMVQTQIKSQPSPVPKQAGKKQQEIKTPASQQKVQMKLPTMRKPETEPIRLNVRKTLAELLTTRIRETEDLKLSDDEIGELALNIELELFKFFKDTGAKYKAKYRSLVFNIKDTKNLTLFRKVADRSLTPDAVVRLSPDEMASQELAEWREKETKHQLEMIKKNELDMMSQAKSIVVKTHKGEQIIENDGAVDRVDPKTPVQDIVTALNSAENITSTVDDEDREKGEKPRAKGESKRSKSSGEDKRKKDKGRDREKDSGRDREKEKEKEKRESRSKKRRHSGERERSRTRERSRDRRSTRSKDARRDRDRDREREKEREKERERDRERDKEWQRDKEKYKKGRGGTGTRGGGSGGRDYKDKDKKEGERKREVEKKKEEIAPTTQQQPPPPTLPPPAQEKPIEDRLWRHVEDETSTNTFDGNDSDVSDREPSSTVTIKTPDINEELEREREPVVERDVPRGPVQTAWRGFVNMVDVAKFFITAQEVSGHARDLMDDLPDTVDVVGRISHETVWDYISKMKKTGSKEILVIRLTAANDEEKIPYITLYSYLNSRSRLGVVGNVSKNIKDFYIMPFSSQSELPSILLPLDGPGFEARRPHLLLGIIVRNKRKRASAIIPVSVPSKIAKKESTDRSYTPPLMSKDKTRTSTPPSSPKAHLKTDPPKEKQTVTQLTLETLNKAHVGMSRNVIDSETISKIVPELSSKIDLTSSPSKMGLDDDDDDNENNDKANNDHDEIDVNNDEDDDGDEPYSPGDIDDDNDKVKVSGPADAQKSADVPTNVLSPAKNSSELQRKMDELNRQIEEQKQQIQNISSSFLKEATSTLPGLGLDPTPGGNDSDEAYSPTDSRSFTPPPPGIPKFSQPILDKVSDITIPPNLQEILANVKRQESSKVDPYLPSKPSASFLPTSITSSGYQNTEKYTPSSYSKTAASSRASSEKLAPDASQSPATKESKSTLRSLSDLDLIKKAEEELAAVAAATAASVASTVTLPDLTKPPPPITVKPSVASSITLSPALSPVNTSASHVSTFSSIKDTAEKSAAYKASSTDLHKKSLASDQPKPPGLEDEDYPLFPSSGPPSLDESSKTAVPSKFVPKSGVVLSVKRKIGETPSSVSTPIKAPRTKSRWGQGPAE